MINLPSGEIYKKYDRHPPRPYGGGAPVFFRKEREAPMIRLQDIVVKFGDFTALHNINVHVKEGEFFTFLGP